MKKFLAILLLFVFTSITSAEYFQDYWPAYSWARDNKIITDRTFSAANLYSAITRVEFAQFMMNFSKNVLKMKDPKKNICKLYDVSSLTKEYKEAVLWVCNNWIMWRWTRFFDWNSTLTLAEFATTLSRLFWWNEFSYGSPYYVNHVGALKGIWAIDDVDEPFNVLFRWDVLVMLMRSVSSTTDTSKYTWVVSWSWTTASKWWTVSDWSNVKMTGSKTPDAVINKVALCYQDIDNCNSTSWSGSDTCPVCCDKDWNWVSVKWSAECAQRPSAVTAWTSGSSSNPESAVTWNKTNCWLDSSDSEDVEECWRCLWLKDYTEDSLVFWAEKNDGSLINCNDEWECSLKKFRFQFVWADSKNEFHSMVLDLNYEDRNQSVVKWLAETFNQSDIDLINKCEQQRYYVFDKKKNEEMNWK